MKPKSADSGIKHLDNLGKLRQTVYPKMLDKINILSEGLGRLTFMEVCGTHTMAIGKNAIRQLLPENIRLISGPGCPVCVTHDREIANYTRLALENKNIIIATFGDLLRVPGPEGSLADARAKGADVRVVYSTLDALKLAKDNPEREIVFLGVGFETTAPTVAMAILQARKEGVDNFSVYSMHKVVPPALRVLLEDEEVKIDGFILPGHVSTIIGMEPYNFITKEYSKASVITGFEAEDILQALIMLLEQIRGNKFFIELQYTRGVSVEGNKIARNLLEEVFKKEDSLWRGIGAIPGSGLEIKDELSQYDAAKKFGFEKRQESIKGLGKEKLTEEELDGENTACSCGDILKGKKIPPECKLFKKVCTPLKPIGPCMVSSEGACAAYYRYESGGRFC